MIHTIGNCNSGTCHLQLQPNRPMNWHGSQRAWLWLSLPPFILAVLLAAQGLWPVLPFAGLEMLLLYAAFYVSSRRQFGEEQLCVEEHKVLIRIRRGECVREQCLPRAWTRLQVVPGARRWYPNHLYLVYRGHRTEIGAELTEPERHQLLASLRATGLPIMT